MTTRYQRGNQKPLWYLVVIVLSVFLALRLLITSLIYRGHCTLCLLSLTASDYPFGILWSLYCLSSYPYGLWLPLWYLVVIVLSVFLSLRLVITSLIYRGHCPLCLLSLSQAVRLRRQRVQWPQDTKEVITSRKAKKTESTVTTIYQRGNHKP
jgi:hypothetical protein